MSRQTGNMGEGGGNVPSCTCGMRCNGFLLFALSKEYMVDSQMEITPVVLITA